MTPHPTEEDLVLARWGEGDAAAVRDHLASCTACRDRDRSYGAVLAAVAQALEAPAPQASGDDLWARLAPRLREPAPAPRLLRFPLRPAFRRMLPPLAAAALLVLAFLAGRLWPARSAVSVASGPDARERILFVAVSDHFDRSQILLLELAHAPAGGTVDVSSERSRASDLLFSNRLFRQAAATSGDPANQMVESVLDDLERVLLDVAHGPSELSEPELDALRRRIESQGLLFKVRVLGARVKTGENIQERNRT